MLFKPTSTMAIYEADIEENIEYNSTKAFGILKPLCELKSVQL